MDCDGRPACGVCDTYTESQMDNGIKMGFSYYPIVNRKCTVNNRYLPIFFITILDDKSIDVKYFNKEANKEVHITVEPRNPHPLDASSDSIIYDVPIEREGMKMYHEVFSIRKTYFKSF